VTIVDFIQENMRVLATVCDRSIGGRNFDDVIVEFLAESFQKKTGTYVTSCNVILSHAVLSTAHRSDR
jgi:molecular chaperone DnaK (HSP70)